MQKKTMLLVLTAFGTSAVCFLASMTVVGYPLNAPSSPIVLIPGHGGNQMEWMISLSEDSQDAKHCLHWNTYQWERSWLDVWQLIPGNIDCWSRLSSLKYNVSTGQYSNHPGVKTRVPGWGLTNTIEYIDPSYTAWIVGNVGSYGEALVKEIHSWGYESGEDLLGAPYDFRYGCSSQPDHYQDKLKALIEDSYHKNGRKPVTLLAHSMGGLMAHYFLIHQPREWKDHYVKELVTLSTPWKGCITMIHAVLSGYTWGHDLGLDCSAIRRVQRNSQSGFYLFPSPSLWTDNETLVETPDRNYTAHDYDDLMEDIGFKKGVHMWNDVREYLEGLEHPGVKVMCLYGTGIPTADTLIYGVDKFPDAQPMLRNGNGDGTVNERSLKACQMWKESSLSSGYPVIVHSFQNVTHNGMVRDSQVLSYLRDKIKAGTHRVITGDMAETDAPTNL